MLLRVRGPSGTYKVRCEPSTRYAELIAEVERQCEWAGEAGALRLSLNKKDQLELEQAGSIGSAGIRGGDLLYIIADADAITRAPPPVTLGSTGGQAQAPRQTSAAAAAAAAAAERRASANSYTIAPPAPTAPHRQVRTTTVRYPAASDMLVEMGFERAQSDTALGMCDGDAERAVELITSGALDSKAVERAASGSGPDVVINTTVETEQVGTPPLSPPCSLQLDEVYGAVRDGLLHELAEAGFEEQAQEQSGRHTFRILISEGLYALATVQISTLGEYVNVHAMAWDGAPVHLLTYGGPGTALGFSLTDLLCSLVTEWKRKVIRPMLFELSTGAMLRAAATPVPAEILAVALHSVMLSNGFENKIKHAREQRARGDAHGCRLPAGWNLGGGNFSFEYSLSASVQRPDVLSPSVLVKAVAMGDRLMVHAMVEDTEEDSTDMQQSTPPVFDACFSIREHTDVDGIALLQASASGSDANGSLTLAPLSAPADFAAACSTQLLGKLLSQISPPPTLASMPLEARVLICTHLPLQAVGRAALICKDWRSATCVPSVWRSYLERDFPKALVAMKEQSAGTAAAPGERQGEEVDWRELYRVTRITAERERKRKAEEEERLRRRRHQFTRQPEPRPDIGIPHPAPGGGEGRWGFPGRNPLMAGGDYDRMPNLPAAPGGGLMIPGSGNFHPGGRGGMGTNGGPYDILPGGGYSGGGLGIPLRGGGRGGGRGRGGGMGGFQPMGGMGGPNLF